MRDLTRTPLRMLTPYQRVIAHNQYMAEKRRALGSPWWKCGCCGAWRIKLTRPRTGLSKEHVQVGKLPEEYHSGS